MNKVLLAFLITISMVSISSAEFYKWKDKNGNWCFSDRKPVNSTATEFNVKANIAGERHQASAIETSSIDEFKRVKLKFIEKGALIDTSYTTWTITGSVKNKGQKTATGCRVVIRCLDKRGRFVHLEDVELRPNTLPPNKIGTFELEVPTVNGVAKFEYKLKANEI